MNKNQEFLMDSKNVMKAINADKENAIKCEKSHKQVSEIKDTRYSANFAYPNKILVRFKDGHEIWYKG